MQNSSDLEIYSLPKYNELPPASYQLGDFIKLQSKVAKRSLC